MTVNPVKYTIPRFRFEATSSNGEPAAIIHVAAGSNLLIEYRVKRSLIGGIIYLDSVVLGYYETAALLRISRDGSCRLTTDRSFGNGAERSAVKITRQRMAWAGQTRREDEDDAKKQANLQPNPNQVTSENDI